MPLPKRKHSKTVQRLRRMHMHLETPQSGVCPKCGEPIKPHNVCKSCGQYKGRQVLKESK